MTSAVDDGLQRLLERADQAEEDFASRPDTERVDVLVAAWSAVVATEDCPEYRNELGNALLNRFDLGGAQEDLVYGLECYEAAVRGADPADPAYLNNLGNALHQSFPHTSDPAVLDRAVTVLTEAVQIASDDPELPVYVDNLVRCLADRFDLRGDPADLDRRIGAEDSVLRLMPEDAPGRGLFLGDLRDVLLQRYLVAGDSTDLDRAVAAATDALALTDPTEPQYPGRLAGLGAVLYHRWDDSGQAADLAAAGSAFDKLERLVKDIDVSPDDPEWWVRGDLGVHYLYRYRALGARTDLDRSVAWSRQALAADSGDSLRLGNNLGRALRLRYNVAGDPDDLDEAITVLRRAGDAIPAFPAVEAGYLVDLGNALLDRFDQRGTVQDLDEAVLVLREATQRLPYASPERAGAYNDLANALRTRFTHSRDPADLADAGNALTEALQRWPGGAPTRYLALDNLANILVDEFTVTGHQDRLDRAGVLFDDALVDLPHSPERTRVLANRGAALWYRWQVSGQPDDLDRVVEAFRDAVRLTPPGDTGRAVRLNNLAVTLLERLAHTPGPDDADQARAAFDEATSPATSADALWGLRAAREWGRWAESRGDWSEAAVAYHRAHDAMRELFLRQGRRGHQEQWLREARGVAVEAGYAAYAARHTEEAATLLESGRGLLLAQALSSAEYQLARLPGRAAMNWSPGTARRSPRWIGDRIREQAQWPGDDSIVPHQRTASVVPAGAGLRRSHCFTTSCVAIPPTTAPSRRNGTYETRDALSARGTEVVAR